MTDRAERINFDVAVRFESDDAPVAGRTVNVSESGLYARFAAPLEVWINGNLLLTAGEYILKIPARVARVMGEEAGVTFVIESENDRLSVKILVDSAKSATATAVRSEPAG